MEKDTVVTNVFKSKHQLTQAHKKIAALQTLCEKREQRERIHCNEILFYHKKTARLEQNVLVANRKIKQLQVMNQEAEKRNKTRRDEYLEACKTISSLEAKNLSLVNRDFYLEKQIQNINQSVKEMEKENLAALQKVSELEQAQDLLERKRKDAVKQVYKLQTKNAELEATLEFFNRRNRQSGQEDLKSSYLGGNGSFSSEVESSELMECDPKTTDGLTEMERKVDVLKREKETILERLRDAENDILEGERMNTELRQEVVELKKMVNERDNQVKQCKQLYERARREAQEKICKLEDAVYFWQSKYDQCRIDLEKESYENRETKDLGVEQGHEACWECEIRLRACHSEVAERDITIAYLQKINESHEDKIRQILNKYKQSNTNGNTFKKDVTARNFSSVSDLHHEVQILLAFYKKRSENATLELNKWKALAIEARSCREKETSLFESQLSIISKDYCGKYEDCRSLLEKEKSKRVALEGQICRLLGKSGLSREFESEYLQKHPHFKRLHDSLVSENDDDNFKHDVTQCHSQIAHLQDFEALMEDSEDRAIPVESTAGDKDVTEPEITLKHENSNVERDSGLENVSSMIDAEKEAVREHVEGPVDSNRVYEAITNTVLNGSNNSGDLQGTVDDESLKKEAENLRRKNKELEALCEKLQKEREEASQTNAVSGQQSLEMAAKCEDYQNQIQKLKQELEDAAARYSALEKTYSDCKVENQKLEELVRELGARVAVLESERGTTVGDSSNMETITQAAEVVQAPNDGLQEIEDALNEGFAAQDEKTAPEKPEVKPVSKAAGVENEKSGKFPGHVASLPRKFPSTSTAPMPFKLHTSPSHSTRQRTRSVDHTNAQDRRESVGSDASDSVASGDAASDGRPRFMQKKLSSSHLDAFKPKPFKKQTSLADDVHLYSRPRKDSGSKTESTGSASDSESGRDTANQQESIVGAADSADGTSPVGKRAKEPPNTLPKPRRALNEQTAFQAGFSKQEYYNSIRPPKSEDTPPNEANLKKQNNEGELV